MSVDGFPVDGFSVIGFSVIGFSNDGVSVVGFSVIGFSNDGVSASVCSVVGFSNDGVIRLTEPFLLCFVLSSAWGFYIFSALSTTAKYGFCSGLSYTTYSFTDIRPRSSRS